MTTHRLLPAGARPPLAIVGTTASGKSSLAMALARHRGDVELVSVDSMQVYRGMDIGTAKPTAAEQSEVRHHVIDLVDPWEPFEVHSFQQAVAEALADIAERDQRAVLVGGTGLYLQAVIDGFEIPARYPEVAAEVEAEPDTVALHAQLTGLDPIAASRMEPTNRRRIVRALEVTLGSSRPFSSYGPGVGTYADSPVRQVGIRLPPPVVADRIEARYHQQMASGFLAEVERLADGPPLSRTAAQALGYRELLRYVAAGGERQGSGAVRPGAGAGPWAGPGSGSGSGPGPGSGSGSGSGAGAGSEPELTLDQALDEAIRRTRAFARRQRAWFRRDPRITWLDADPDPSTQVQSVTELAASHWG